jgi:hypothetical protein
MYLSTPPTCAQANIVGSHDPNRVGIAMQFTRVVSPIEEMEVWNASSAAVSFVISYVSQSGPGFHGRTGFAVSWRPIDQNRSAVSVGGSPFETLAEAQEACNAMAAILTKAGPMGARVNFGARAVLRKWPSLRNECRADATGPYLVIDSTLDEGLREFMSKPTSVRHLYEIHTAPLPPLASAVLPEGVIFELARLRGFDRIA